MSSITRSASAFLTSIMTKRKPLDNGGDRINPGVFMTSANARYRGKLNAPGSVLSAAKNRKGSPGRSSNSISATAGPIPFTFPENDSLNKSWPAP